jgi:hypothetical protein
MGLGRPKVALILTDDERVRLDSLAHRSRTEPHLARRARIILTCAEGYDNKVVAKRLRMSQVTVTFEPRHLFSEPRGQDTSRPWRKSGRPERSRTMSLYSSYHAQAIRFQGPC